MGSKLGGGSRGTHLAMAYPFGSSICAQRHNAADVVVVALRPKDLPGLRVHSDCERIIEPRATISLLAIANYGGYLTSGPLQHSHGMVELIRDVEITGR